MWWPAYAGVIVVRHKVRQSYISRTVWPRNTKIYTTLHTGRLYYNTGYDLTDYFRLAVIEVKINGRKWRLRRFRCCLSRETFELKSPNFMWKSIPTCCTFPPREMTSPTTSGRKLSGLNRRKCRLSRYQVEFLKKGLDEDHQISHCCRDDWPHKSAGYDVTSCFQLYAKSN